MTNNEPERPRDPEEDPAEVLTGQDWSEDVDLASQSDLRRAISNAMVGMKKRYFGKGPTNARTYINDRFVFCVLEGGVTRSERTLIDSGQEETVRAYRLKFEEAMTEVATEAIEQLTGRKVVGYHSQFLFGPDYGFEIFVLDEAPGKT